MPGPAGKRGLPGNEGPKGNMGATGKDNFEINVKF